VRRSYADFDYKRIFAALNAFMTADLFRFYFEHPQDALYLRSDLSITRNGLPEPCSTICFAPP